MKVCTLTKKIDIDKNTWDLSINNQTELKK